MAFLLEAAAANVKPIVFALANIVSVTAIVAVNKVVFSVLDFHFPITLVCIHTIITWLGLRLASGFGAFEPKTLPAKPRLVLAASFVFYNVASLVNLNVNTVGFYQISKILITPTVMLMQYLMSGQGSTTPVKLAVAIMLIGVTMATVSDVDVTPFGFIVGMLAVLGAAQSQILIGDMQKALKASANQLLLAYTPYVVLMLVIVSPLELMLAENKDLGFAAYGLWMRTRLSGFAVSTIVLSGCFGLLVSLSTFLMIGATSALTYNIVGHLKTVSILFTGFVLFGDSMGPKKFFGICCALIGVFWYSKIQLDKQTAAKLPAAPVVKPESTSPISTGVLAADHASALLGAGVGKTGGRDVEI